MQGVRFELTNGLTDSVSFFILESKLKKILSAVPLTSLGYPCINYLRISYYLKVRQFLPSHISELRFVLSEHPIHCECLLSPSVAVSSHEILRVLGIPCPTLQVFSRLLQLRLESSSCCQLSVYPSH